VRDREVARAPFTRDDGRGRRCLEATAHGSGLVSLTAELSASIATSVASVERFSHRRLTAVFALPSLGFVLGLALLLFSRQRAVAEARDRDATTTRDDGYAPPTAPASWPLGWTFAIGAYLAVQLVNVVVAVAWIAIYRPEGGADGLTIAVSTLSQHALLSVASFALLGALRTDGNGALAPDWRARLGFTPISRKGALASVTLALSLVAVAIASTKLIPDLNSSPLGQLLERSPARYAIAFGAMIAPFSEELFFRGALVTAFGRKSVWRGAIVSTIVFTLAHAAQLRGAWAGLIPICAVGACNAALRARTGGLSYPWLVHTLYNGALTASLYFT
jgi:membrane protease YdiL (CAAX protease family)